MKRILAVFVAIASAVASTSLAANYSTEATMSLQKNEGTYLVEVRVSRLLDQNGKTTEQVIARPEILSAPGVPASLHQGLQPKDPNYAKEENVTVDVSWPYPNESGVALCSVVIKRGDIVVSKSRFQLNIEGPGRTPLVIKTEDVGAKSVQVTEDKSSVYLFFELTGKTKGEIKKLANENYGNKVQICDLRGHIIDGGLSFGTYKETELTVQYGSKDEAERAAGVLRGNVTN
jgi:hypothetical protein